MATISQNYWDFEAENTNSIAFQQLGWQSILGQLQKVTESKL